jgi:hypothetical protein
VADISLSRLNLIKSYVGTITCQERLSDLAILDDENDLSSTTEYSEILGEFSSKKSCKWYIKVSEHFTFSCFLFRATMSPSRTMEMGVSLHWNAACYSKSSTYLLTYFRS